MMTRSEFFDLLVTLREAQERWPDQRVCQVIANATGRADPFTVEDEGLQAALERYARLPRVETKILARCPGCEDWIEVDDGQLASAISVIHKDPGCGYHGYLADERAVDRGDPDWRTREAEGQEGERR